MRPEIGSLEGHGFDVVIIGAGINGASAAQHLAAAGYATLLVDQGDFGSGASSRSSRLLHCGLRYLAPGRSILDFVRHPTRLATALRMARLAMRARSEFVETSPGRTDVVRMHFPIYRDGPYAGWQVDLAFRTLALLGGRGLPLDYRRLSAAEAGRLPLVGQLGGLDRLESVAAFREYQFDWPERIGLDAVLDAERNGAVVRNYTKARLAARAPGGGWQVELTDMLAQSAPATVTGALVLNMAGIWIDDVARAANPQAGRKVFGTKGCHVVVKLPDECRGLGIATLNSKSEPFYCIPWKHLHYFGPTETLYDGDPDQVFVTAAEQAWLLGEANRLLPAFALGPKDVVMTWAGVRPLTYDPAVPFGNRSRVVHDFAADGLADMLAMTAGPVMTHRSAGRELAARVGTRLGARPGGRAPDFARPGGADADGEHAARLSDVLFRRRGIAWSGPVPEADLADAAAELGDRLGWDAGRRTAEIATFRSEWDRLYAPRRADIAARSHEYA